MSLKVYEVGLDEMLGSGLVVLTARNETDALQRAERRANRGNPGYKRWKATKAKRLPLKTTAKRPRTLSCIQVCYG